MVSCIAVHSQELFPISFFEYFCYVLPHQPYYKLMIIYYGEFKNIYWYASSKLGGKKVGHLSYCSRNGTGTHQ